MEDLEVQANKFTKVVKYTPMSAYLRALLNKLSKIINEDINK